MFNTEWGLTCEWVSELTSWQPHTSQRATVKLCAAAVQRHAQSISCTAADQIDPRLSGLAACMIRCKMLSDRD